jgi:hypothetical protein
MWRITAEGVAQIFNLLYRRPSACEDAEKIRGRAFVARLPAQVGDTAD